MFEGVLAIAFSGHRKWRSGNPGSVTRHAPFQVPWFNADCDTFSGTLRRQTGHAEARVIVIRERQILAVVTGSIRLNWFVDLTSTDSRSRSARLRPRGN